MRQTQIFSGTSHPELVDSICNRLGQEPAKSQLAKFSNGETSVQIKTSIRDQDVFIVQSGSSTINDAVMELLIMVSACKGGSAKSITAVMPYFPYCRQSKKKSHRGAITARMLANQLEVAGVNHVITIDLHASQMQGFFRCPVDNLVAEPLLAHWIKLNVPEWRSSICVSKNPGGTKRTTSLADALKVGFGIIMTDRARPSSGRTSLANSTILSGMSSARKSQTGTDDDAAPNSSQKSNGGQSTLRQERFTNGDIPNGDAAGLERTQTAPSAMQDDAVDERNRDVVTGRLMHGHIIDDHAPSPTRSAVSFRAHHDLRRIDSDDDLPDHMTSSVFSTASSHRHGHDGGLGGSGDAVASSDDEEEMLKDPVMESTVTLVGKVRGHVVLIIDDMIDKSASWIAAAETVVKRGGATKVYCMATHGLFGGDCLREMEECECIDKIIVTDAFPIPKQKRDESSKLVVLDVSGLLSEAIRRNHHGESIHQLFVHQD